MTLKIRRLSHALGAEVVGLDISRPLDDATAGELRSAFLEYYLLLFRGHPLTREQHIAFTRHFGEVDQNEGNPIRNPDYPEISMIVSKPTPDGKAPTGRITGQDWHTDRSHLPAACMAS